MRWTRVITRCQIRRSEASRLKIASLRAPIRLFALLAWHAAACDRYSTPIALCTRDPDRRKSAHITLRSSKTASLCARHVKRLQLLFAQTFVQRSRMIESFLFCGLPWLLNKASCAPFWHSNLWPNYVRIKITFPWFATKRFSRVSSNEKQKIELFLLSWIFLPRYPFRFNFPGSEYFHFQVSFSWNEKWNCLFYLFSSHNWHRRSNCNFAVWSLGWAWFVCLEAKGISVQKMIESERKQFVHRSYSSLTRIFLISEEKGSWLFFVEVFKLLWSSSTKSRGDFVIKYLWRLEQLQYIWNTLVVIVYE